MKIGEIRNKVRGKFAGKPAGEGKEKKSLKKIARDFWYGKPHEERRLGDLYIGDTGLYKHREWRGVVDTMYYFNMIWLYNYAHMVTDILKYGGGPKGIVNFAKGTWRYRWMGQTYLTVMHWFDRGLEGMRGPILAGSAWHYRGMVSETIRQFMEMFHPPGCGRIREISHAIPFQRTALHFHQIFFSAPPEIEINAGTAPGVFGMNFIKTQSFQPLRRHMVRRLAVDVHQTQARFGDRHQVVGGLPLRIVRPVQEHLRPGQQQLPAAAGVLHMNGFRPARGLHMGNEAVRPVYERSPHNIFILHDFLFIFIAIILTPVRQPVDEAAPDL